MRFFFYRDRNRHTFPFEIAKSITAACLRRGMPFLTPSLIFLPLSPPPPSAAIDFFKQSARDSIFRDSRGDVDLSPRAVHIRVYTCILLLCT